MHDDSASAGDLHGAGSLTSQASHSKVVAPFWGKAGIPQVEQRLQTRSTCLDPHRRRQSSQCWRFPKSAPCSIRRADLERVDEAGVEDVGAWIKLYLPKGNRISCPQWIADRAHDLAASGSLWVWARPRAKASIQASGAWIHENWLNLRRLSKKVYKITWSGNSHRFQLQFFLSQILSNAKKGEHLPSPSKKRLLWLYAIDWDDGNHLRRASSRGFEAVLWCQSQRLWRPKCPASEILARKAPHFQLIELELQLQATETTRIRPFKACFLLPCSSATTSPIFFPNCVVSSALSALFRCRKAMLFKTANTATFAAMLEMEVFWPEDTFHKALSDPQYLTVWLGFLTVYFKLMSTTVDKFYWKLEFSCRRNNLPKS